MVSESVLYWALALGVSAAIVVFYAVGFRRRTVDAHERKREAAELGIDRPTAQYPFIDPNKCIGCGACVQACPEGDPLGVVGGTAVVINGLRCVGHGHCEMACPVGAIEVGLGDLKGRKDIPLLDERYETSTPGVYIAGELGGLALVRNACRQGREAAEAIARDLAASGAGPRAAGILDLVIVGAGPAGLSAALTAGSAGLDYLVLEREATLGGSLLHYPRRKMVLTQPVELGSWGRLDQPEYSKEDLLELLARMVDDEQLEVAFESPVESVRQEGSDFAIVAGGETRRARRVLLCLGRRGTPRKLGVPGEESSKVMYRLIDAASYEGERLLVVGGGDSAIEAAMGLANQASNRVTISYRKSKFFRIKKKNEERVERAIASGRVETLFDSQVKEILPDRVRLEVAGGEIVELPNDYVFVFAGGVPPFEFLRQAGVRFGGDPVETPAPAARAASR
jgi:thioredoxin reductase/Pyruvate/2-oxoacid:ferredoxin oxidoreductase delta subunit